MILAQMFFKWLSKIIVLITIIWLEGKYNFLIVKKWYMPCLGTFNRYETIQYDALHYNIVIEQRLFSYIKPDKKKFPALLE